jgi:DNA-binding NarL/FixJ family response regulator
MVEGRTTPPNEGVDPHAGLGYQGLEWEANGNGTTVSVKILIVDDHALFRAGLRMLLGTIGHDVSCLEAATVTEALASVAKHSDIELCLLDLNLKNEQGFGAIEHIKQTAPQVAVVVVSGSEDSATIRSCIDAGAMSYIPKSVVPEILTYALQRVLAGAVYLPEQVMNALAALPQAGTLTPRQQQVLQGLSRGLPTKLIARELELSEHTVKEYIAIIFQTLGVHNRTEAVIKASQLQRPEASGAARR